MKKEVEEQGKKLEHKVKLGQVTCDFKNTCDFCIPSINGRHGEDHKNPPSHGVPTSRDELWVDGSLG